jgi:hypothetical protein
LKGQGRLKKRLKIGQTRKFGDVSLILGKIEHDEAVLCLFLGIAIGMPCANERHVLGV